MLHDILNNSKKINSVNDIIENLDIILDLSKDDVYKISKSKKIYFHDFDYFYSESIRILKSQLRKTHLKSIKNIHSSHDINFALSWIISRLINNMRNISTNRKYKNYVMAKIINTQNFDFHIQNNDSYDLLDEIPIDELKGGLRIVYEKNQLYQDFDLEDFEKLCNKFALNSADIIGYDPREKPKMKAELTKSGNSQLILFFDN